VWNSDGKKVFQRGLTSIKYIIFLKCVDLLTVWTISNDYFIYQPVGEDENSDCFHITNLKKDNATILLPDFIKDPNCIY
jgi:hypothetical protein